MAIFICSPYLQKMHEVKSYYFKVEALSAVKDVSAQKSLALGNLRCWKLYIFIKKLEQGWSLHLMRRVPSAGVSCPSQNLKSSLPHPTTTYHCSSNLQCCEVNMNTGPVTGIC